MYKPEVKAEAVKLRKVGYSYSDISERLHISKPTLCAWLKSVPYAPNKENLLKRERARTAAGARKRELKRDSFKRAFDEARADLGKVSKRDLLMLGIGLYIGEGAKLDGMTRVINADPRVIKLSMQWFMDCFGLSREAFRVRIHIYPDNDPAKCLRFWSGALEIPESQFFSFSIDRRLGKKMAKRGKLPYGTAHMTVKGLGNKAHGVFLSRKIRAYMEEVLPKAGIV